MEEFSGAEIAALRHLLGLSEAELAGMLGVRRDTVRDWARGKFKPGPGRRADLAALRAEHDAETARLAEGARSGVPIYLPRGSRAKPNGWYVALGARVIDRNPMVMLEWHEAEA